MTEEQLYAHLLVCSEDISLVETAPDFSFGWDVHPTYLGGLGEKGNWVFMLDIPDTVDPTDRHEVLRAVAHEVIHNDPNKVRAIVNSAAPISVTVFPAREESEDWE